MSEAEPQPARRRWWRWRPDRKRLIELVIIIFGVLIALGLENSVQEWRWRQEGRDLERLARQELELNLAQAIERIAVDRCLRERVAFLAAGLDKATGSYAPQPFPHDESNSTKLALPRAYQPMLRPWRSASLQRLLATEASKRVSPERLLIQSQVLFTVESIARDAGEEHIASGRTLPLAMGIPTMTPEIRADLLADLGELDRARSGVELVARRLTDRGAELGVAPDPAEMRQRLIELRATWGDCVDIAAGMALSQRLSDRAT